MSYSPGMKFRKIRFKAIYLIAILIINLIAIFAIQYIIKDAKLDPLEINDFTLISEEKELRYYKMYHNETKVIYLIYYNGDMIMLRDCNGLPAVYEGGY